MFSQGEAADSARRDTISRHSFKAGGSGCDRVACASVRRTVQACVRACVCVCGGDNEPSVSGPAQPEASLPGQPHALHETAVPLPYK